MTLSTDGLCAKVYQEWELRGGKRPSQLNLCHVFRVVVLWGPTRRVWCNRLGEKRVTLGCQWSLAASWSFAGSLILVELLNDPFNVLLIILRVLTGLSLVFLLPYSPVAYYYLRQIYQRSEVVKVTVAYLAARKRRMCPLVEFKGEGR